MYDAKLAAFIAKLEPVGTAEVALQTLRVERDALRTELEQQLNGRGSYVEAKSEGDAAKILSAGFEIVSAPTPTTSLPAPTNVLGTKPGEIVISGNAVPKAKSYIYECREHAEDAAPGTWSQVKVGTRSTFTAKGLVSGRRYAFRIMALGPKDLESPWSDEPMSMAP